jgi:hypothetical protein
MFALTYTIRACLDYAEKIRKIQQVTGAEQKEAEEALAWAYGKGIFVDPFNVSKCLIIIEEYRKREIK